MGRGDHRRGRGVKSSSLRSGEYDHRYKVRLTLQWKDFRKEVLVTLNDRTDMEFPCSSAAIFWPATFWSMLRQNNDPG